MAERWPKKQWKLSKMCRSLQRLPSIAETEVGSRPNKSEVFQPSLKFKVLCFQKQVDEPAEPWEKNIRIPDSDDEDPTWWMRFPQVLNKKLCVMNPFNGRLKNVYTLTTKHAAYMQRYHYSNQPPC